MAGKDAFGTKWSFSTDGTTFNDIASVTNIDVLDIKVDTLETTAHDSANQWRTFLGGLKDAGELSMDINYDATLHGTLYSNIGGATRKHRVTLPDGTGPTTGTKIAFDAIITGYKAQAPFDDKLSATVTLKLSGAPVITPSS